MKPWYQRCWEFCWAPLVDRYNGISITRAIALYFAYLTGRSVSMQQGAIGLNTLWLGLAAIAAAFGKSTFTFLLQRLQFSGTRTEADVKVDVTARKIQERRGSSDYEPTP